MRLSCVLLTVATSLSVSGIATGLQRLSHIFSFSFRSDEQVEQKLGYRVQVPGYLNYRPGACGGDKYQLLGNTNQRDYT